MSHQLMPKFLTFFFPRKFVAITVTGNLSWYRNQEQLDRESVRKHEDVHQRQIREDGWLTFMVKYFYWSWKYGYRENPYEKSAYAEAPIIKGK